MYSVSAYGAMIADRIRMDAYAAALRRAVRPGSVVVDLGAGTGIMTLLACRCGARRVFAIEPDDVIQVAREVIASNGYADRVEFFQDLSIRVTLPEPADVIVSDIRGVLPLHERHIPSVADARARFLTPHGVLIPQRDTLWVALVEAPREFSRNVAPESTDGQDFDFAPARCRAANSWFKARIAPEQLLVEPRCWATLDYTTLVSPDVGAQLDWSAARNGTAHGWLVWFDSVLFEDVGFSNAPASLELIYGAAFFPLREPVSVRAKDHIQLVLRADLVAQDYVWRWNSRFTDSAGGAIAAWEQSTFFAAPLSQLQLRKQAAAYLPSLNEEGAIDLFILESLRAGIALGEIAAQLAAKFPAQFLSVQQALARAGELSHRYSR